MRWMHRALAALAGVGVGVGAAAGQDLRVATLEITGAPRSQPSPLAWLLGAGAEPTLRDYVWALHDAAEDREIQKVLIRLKDAELSMTDIEEMAEAIREIKRSGKTVHLYCEVADQAPLVLGSHCDEIVLQAGGAVSLPGMFMEEIFLADTLAWAGVKAELVQIGDYKGANEQMTRNAPSAAWDQNIDSLLDSMYANIRGALAKGRGLNAPALDGAMQVAWLAKGDTAKKVGLIDAEVDLPGLGDHLAKKPGAEVAWSEIEVGEDVALDMSNPFMALQVLMQEPEHEPAGPTIAVVYVTGVIVDGDSTEGGLFGEGSAGSRTVRNALEKVLEEDEIKGVVVRVDSPGGSAIASEVIWQGIRRVAAKKPVWVSVGSMAASGGYYVAVAGDKIYVDPSSIVGSIGVVGGKISMGGLYDKLKVKVKTRSRGPRAAMFDTTRTWTEEEVGLVRAAMAETYDLFTHRVSQGRKEIDLSKTAEGRLFTGNKAVPLKMADDFGGLDIVIADMADTLGLEEYDVMDYPGPKGLGELIEEALGGVVSAPEAGKSGLGTDLIGVLREAVGPRAWPAVRDSLGGLMQLREERVLLMMPRAIVVR